MKYCKSIPNFPALHTLGAMWPVNSSHSLRLVLAAALARFSGCAGCVARQCLLTPVHVLGARYAGMTNNLPSGWQGRFSTRSRLPTKSTRQLTRQWRFGAKRHARDSTDALAFYCCLSRLKLHRQTNQGLLVVQPRQSDSASASWIKLEELACAVHAGVGGIIESLGFGVAAKGEKRGIRLST